MASLSIGESGAGQIASESVRTIRHGGSMNDNSRPSKGSIGDPMPGRKQIDRKSLTGD